MPRDPARIDVFLAEVRDLWQLYPDMRFGQLVVNVLGSDPFYIEDDAAVDLFMEARW